MAVEQQCAAEFVEQALELLLDRTMIGAMRLGQPLLQLITGDRLPPQRAVGRRSSRHNSESAAGSGAKRGKGAGPDDRRVDLVFGAIAVDRGSGRLRDDCAHTLVDRALDKVVHQRVFKRGRAFSPPLLSEISQFG